MSDLKKHAHAGRPNKQDGTARIELLIVNVRAIGQKSESLCQILRAHTG